ncbi:MAG: cell division protein ZapA [Treponema sp.]|jgi:cell division protein ZapA (FtsZ GTPase activity inhibitor)|nr:cell division protein ZapA [Treponema sp.]
MSKNDQSQRNERIAKGARSMKNDLYIDLLGTSFSITAEEEPVYLEGVLNNYRLALGNIQDSTGLRDPLKLAILTGFLLCDKIQRIYQREAAEQIAENYETTEAEQITLDMIARIDEVLESDR